MTRRSLILFAAMGLLWGLPYLFIKEAVDSLAPAVVVSGRTLGAAVLLLPLAARQGAIGPALGKWKWVLAFGAIEMSGPFVFLSHAEQTLPSGLTGLLVSTVPLVAAVIGFATGDRGSLSALRVAGLAVGITGVALVIGTSGEGTVTPLAIGEVIATAICYATAPFVVARKLGDVPALGTISLSLTAVGIAYIPVAALTQDGAPTTRSVTALAALTVVCTAVAFVVFFALIDELGPVRAPLFTYINPLVAVTAGVVILGEQLTAGMLAGIPLILAGCWFAAGRPLSKPALGGAPIGVPTREQSALRRRRRRIPSSERVPIRADP